MLFMLFSKLLECLNSLLNSTTFL